MTLTLSGCSFNRGDNLPVDYRPKSAVTKKLAKSPSKKSSSSGAAKAKVTSRVNAPKLAPGTFIITLDPGHGGKDYGAASPGKIKIYEKNVVLRFAQLLKTTLERKNPKFRVILTRDSDKFVPLANRVQLARQYRSHLFMSLHADSAPGAPTAQGVSVYTRSNEASDKAAARLVQSENAEVRLSKFDWYNGDPEAMGVLFYMTHRETINAARRWARYFLTACRDLGINTIYKHNNLGGSSGPLWVLGAPEVPSVLIEMGFLSNRADLHKLQNQRYHQQLANAIAKSVEQYYNQWLKLNQTSYK